MDALENIGAYVERYDAYEQSLAELMASAYRH
jgi:hypothetical protein